MVLVRPFRRLLHNRSRDPFERLRFRYGFSNLVLQWLTSYLVDHPGQVFFPASSFIMWSPSRLRFRTGVKLFFPLYFSIGSCNYGSVGLNAMMIADDSQLYIIMRQSNRGTGLQGLTLCIQDIMSCNVSNLLKCNSKKAEIIHFSSRFYRPSQFLLSRLEILLIILSNEVKNLGVTLDRHLTFNFFRA